MSLRRTTVLIMAVTLACLVGIITIASDRIIRTRVLHIEQAANQQDVERVLEAIAAELSGLHTSARDWAFWDDMYQFAEDGNKEFADSNLNAKAFATLKIDLFAMVDMSGKIKVAMPCDRETGDEAPMPDGLDAYLPTSDNPGSVLGSQQSGSGLVTLSGRTMLVAWNQIMTSEHEGPARGILIMGHWLEGMCIDGLSKTTRLSLAAAVPEGSLAPAVFEAAGQPAAQDGTPIMLQSKNDEVMTGYALLRDIAGKPSLVIEATIPRVIYQHGRDSLRYFRYALLVAALVYAAVTIGLLEKAVLSQLARLSAGVAAVTHSNDLSLRLNLHGKNELAALAAEINTMLARLEESRLALEDNEGRLARSRDFYLRILDDFPNPIWRAGIDGKRNYFNKDWLAMTGRPLEQETGDGWMNALHPDNREDYLHTYRKAIESRSPFTVEYRLLLAGGNYGWLLEAGRPVAGLDGEFAGCIGSCYDITERRKMEEALVKQSRALISEIRRNDVILNTMLDGYVVFGTDGALRDVNRAFADIVGYSRQELMEMNLAALLAEESPGEMAARIDRIVQKGTGRFETRHRCKDGSLADVEVSATVLKDGGDAQVIGFVRDITGRLEASKRLQAIAQTDELTAIGNRRSFVDTMEVMGTDRQMSRDGFSLVMCDVDSFKPYNDTYGHVEGDKVLVRITQAMKESLRSADMLFRYGGEEIVAVLPGAGIGVATDVADRLCVAVRALAIEHRGAPAGVVTISCGVAACDRRTPNYRNWEQVLRDADTALYRAKSLGKNRAEAFAA